MSTVLSCIIPVYNAEKYLKKSVESVLSQSFAWFELILVDNASTDESRKLCEEFARQDERVKVITQPKQGVAAARNAGVEAANGRYITFVDADDVLLPKAFEKCVQAMENQNLDLVSFDFVFRSDSQDTPAAYPAFSTQTLAEFWPHFVEYYQANLFFALWNKVYRTQLIKGHCLCFDESMRTGEDIAFNCAYLKNCNKIQHLGSCYYEYWAHPQTLTRQPSLEHMENSQRILHLVRDFLEQCGQSQLYPPLVASQLPWDTACFFDLLPDSSRDYTLQQRKTGLEQLFRNKIWHTALLTQLEEREGRYHQFLRFAVQHKSIRLALLPAVMRSKQSFVQKIRTLLTL